MRFLLALILCALLSACSTKTSELEPTAAAPPPPSLTITDETETPKPSPPQSLSPKPEINQTVLQSQLHHLESAGITLHVFVCDDRKINFTIADKQAGPTTQWPHAESVARSQKAIAAINGGFFTPEGSPLGLVIEAGKKYGRWNANSSLTSGLFSVDQGTPNITRTRNSSSKKTAHYLLQTGPFLLENGNTVSGLSKSRPRPRSFLLWDGKHHWAFGFATNTTLSALAKTLAKQPVPGIQIMTALNLDGGSSSQLWVAKSVKGGPAFHRPFIRKPVRNFILAHESP